MTQTVNRPWYMDNKGMGQVGTSKIGHVTCRSKTKTKCKQGSVEQQPTVVNYQSNNF